MKRASSNAADLPTTGTLSGRVIDAEDVPVVGGRVWVNTIDSETLHEKTLAEARTDADGRFHLGPMEPVYRHRFDIFIETDGFARCYVLGGTYSILLGRDEDLGTIRLDRGCVFTGRVLDVDGTPRSDATVECQVHRFELGHTAVAIGPAQTLTTDSEGRFRTAPLPVGRLYLLIRAPDRQVAGVARPIPPQGQEELDPIRLERDVPIPGAVRDEEGRPVAGAKISANNGAETISDETGKFTLHGFGPNPSFQLTVRKDCHVFVNRSVTVAVDGIHWHEVGGNGKAFGPVKDLAVVMKPKAWIEGQALDADTGELVRLDRVVLCFFQRKPDGEVVLRGCRLSDFEQPEAGRFRVAYSYPDEYHLTLSATGYHDAEAFTPKVTELKTIAGITVKLKKQTDASKSELTRQRIAGTVRRDGQPVKVGWVGLWAPVHARNARNAYVLRGRTVEGGPAVYASAPIRDGAYLLDVPFQDNGWYVVVEEPGLALTQVGPIAVGLNEEKSLDIACVKGAFIRGRVKGIPAGLEGHLWVVAFSRTAIRMEARVGRDGAFAFLRVPPGQYGLKAGHNAYEDSDVPRGLDISEEDWVRPADPWKRARIVEVESDRDHAGVEVEFLP